MGAGGQAGEVAPRLTEQAQRALLQVLVQQLLLAAGGEGQDAGGAAADSAGAFRCLSGCRSPSAFSSFSRRSSGFCSLFCWGVEALCRGTQSNVSRRQLEPVFISKFLKRGLASAQVTALLLLVLLVSQQCNFESAS